MAGSGATSGRGAWLPVVAPVLGVVVLIAVWGRTLPVVVAVVAAAALAGAVLAAVHHAEVIAHKVGEPFGSLTLAIAVTVIEVGLILTLMSSGGDKTAGLARDTVFAAVMITCNGILGLSLLTAARRHGIALFNAEGSGAALATVATLTTLTLVLPTFTTSVPGPEFNGVQLAFAAIASAVIYGVFVVTQTVRHRDFFLPVEIEGDDDADEHAEPPSGRAALASLDLVLAAGVGYEVRTTVHPDVTGPAVLDELARELAARGISRWILQPFRPTGCANVDLVAAAPMGVTLPPELLARLSEHVPVIEVRG